MVLAGHGKYREIRPVPYRTHSPGPRGRQSPPRLWLVRSAARAAPLLVLVASAAARAQAIRHVDDDAPPGGNGLAWTSAYAFPQDALQEATADPAITEIRVAQGNYTPDQGGGWTPGDRTASFQLLDGVTLAGGYAGLGAEDPDERDIAVYETVLNGDLTANDGPEFTNYDENSFHVVLGNGVSGTAVLDGLTVRGGNADGPPPWDDEGGGLRCDSGSPTIRSCKFTENTSPRGAAMDFYRSACPTIIACTIIGNKAIERGGGIGCWLSAPTFIDCTIAQNMGGSYGGGFWSWESSATFITCVFAGNLTYYAGGAIIIGGDGHSTIIDCLISANESDLGGGMFASTLCNALVTGCTISDNIAAEGGGFWCGADMLTLRSNLISSNTAVGAGGAIFAWAESRVAVVNCSIVENTGGYDAGGLACTADARPVISDSILWGNLPRELYTGQDALITIGFSDVQGGLDDVGGTANVDWQGGNIDLDPQFENVPTSDFHLQPDSPCINAGDPNAPVDDEQRDLDGELRIDAGRIDIGSDEFHDCNGNGMADQADIVEGGSTDCTGNTIPDECEPDCNTNGAADSCDIDDGLVLDCTANGIPDVCEPDCNANGWADGCDIAAGTSQDCNGNGVPDECLAMENDCNTDSTPDECEIREGFAADCDSDSKPDVCEDTSADCNTNGVWDACDVAYEISGDADLDGAIDVCEQFLSIHIDDDAPADPGPHDPNVSDPAEDGSAQHPFDAVQEAINAAKAIEDDDPGQNWYVEITLADGTYSGPGNRRINLRGRPYLLHGAGGAVDCVIDCQLAARGFRFVSGETRGTRVSAVTILNGSTAQNGGGIYCVQSSPAVSDCVIASCTAYSGGGIYCRDGSSPTFSGCVIINNTAMVWGGGVLAEYDCDPAFESCTISNNMSTIGGGGGMSFDFASNPTIRDCTFTGNHSGFTGGGIDCDYISNALIVGCTFIGNSCEHIGGGVHFDHCHLTILNSIFQENHAGTSGGGVICHRSSHSTIANCLLYDNTADSSGGAGLASSGCVDLTVSNCTVTGNTAPIGAGFRAWDGYLTLSNNIFWDNSSPDIPVNNYCEIGVHYNDIQGGVDSITGDNILTWGAGNIDADPLFVDAGAADFQLSAGSPCIDAADNVAVARDVLDLDSDGDAADPLPFDVLGHLRFVDDPDTPDTGNGVPPIVDMGAHETQGEYAPGDVNCDGNVDAGDIAALILALVDPTGYAQEYTECDLLLADMNGDGLADGEDISGFVSALLGLP